MSNLRERALAYLKSPSSWTREDIKERLFMAMGLYERMPPETKAWIVEEYESRKQEILKTKEPEPDVRIHSCSLPWRV
jgi:hypothetical protein